MDSTDLTMGAAADRVRGLQITSENQVPVIVESVASKDLSVPITKELDIVTNGSPLTNSDANSISNRTTNGSHAINTGNGITEHTTNDHLASGSIENDAQQENPQTFVHDEAKANDIPDIQINGETEAEQVNKDILGPEDEEDGETPILQSSGNTDVGLKKKKTKKKSKSKRGLVTAPCCRHRIIMLIVEPRMHPLDSRNSMLTPRSLLSSMKKRRAYTTSELSKFTPKVN